MPSLPGTVRAREAALSRLLMAFILSGLGFMLLPGTLLGVWNLLQISGHESAGLISPVWLQAHGHAQVFGWVGSFLLGIGFYSVPKLRDKATGIIRAAWMLPVSALVELSALSVFAINILGTFLLQPSHAVKEPMMVRIAQGFSR